MLNLQLRASRIGPAYISWHFLHVTAYTTLQSVGEPPWSFADLFDEVLVMVSDLLKQLPVKLVDFFSGILSGVTLLFECLLLAKCYIRLFGLWYATIGGSLKVFWKSWYFFMTAL